MNRSAVQQRRVLPTSPFKRVEITTASTADYTVGGRVTHDRLGMGRVVALDAEFVTVDFGDGNIRQIRAGARGFQRL